MIEVKNLSVAYGKHSVLQGVSLDNPDVVEWIEEFLKEQTENICGGAEL